MPRLVVHARVLGGVRPDDLARDPLYTVMLIFYHVLLRPAAGTGTLADSLSLSPAPEEFPICTLTLFRSVQPVPGTRPTSKASRCPFFTGECRRGLFSLPDF